MKIIFIQLIFGTIENLLEKLTCRAHLRVFYKDSITYNTRNSIMGLPQHKCQKVLLFPQSVDGVIYKAVVMKDGS